MNHFNDQLCLLAKLPKCKWSIHEKVVCDKIRIRSRDSVSVRDQMTIFLGIMKKGSIGNKRSGTYTTTGHGPIDLFDKSIQNTFNVFCEQFGSKETFPTSSLSNNSQAFFSPRFFSFGTNVVPSNHQKQLLASVIGTASGLSEETSTRRKKTWRGWFDRTKKDHYSFDTFDLLDIAKQYHYLFDCDVLESFCSQGASKELRKIRSEIQLLLVCSGKIRSRNCYIDVQPTSPNSILSNSTPLVIPLSPKNNKASSVIPPSPDSYQKPAIIPSSLQSSSLKKVTITELAKIEACLFDDKNRCLDEPETISLSLIDSLSLNSLRWARINVKRQRMEYIKNQIFQPHDTQLLLDWIRDGRRYSNGAMLEAENYEIHQQNSQPSMTDEAFSYIRHIIFSFNIPTRRFGSLFSCFSDLLLRKPVAIEKFPDKRSLNRRFARLSIFDWYKTAFSLENYIYPLTTHCFYKYWYSITDDSKHNKVDRHAIMITHKEHESAPPSFKFLTISAAVAKDSAGNTSLNVEAFQSKLSNNILQRYGGNISDNANDALKESRDTFTYICGENRLEHGVRPLPISIGDPFHIDNIAMQEASEKSFGKTERNNHRQRHHRQLMQSIYDLFSLDRLAYQGFLDNILSDIGRDSISVKATRERVQRWLANQRNASWIIEMMEIKRANVPVLLDWAYMIFDHAATANTRIIAKDVVEMLSMPEVLIALNFEREMGLYFEVTSKWHGMPGSLSSRPGFRMMELHTLYHEFIAPWWNSALELPEINFGKTFAAIEDLGNEEEKEKKRNQVNTGIRAAYKKIVRWSEYILSAPLIFTLLTDRERGPALARGIIHIMSKQIIDNPEGLQYEFTGDDWEVYDKQNKMDKCMYDLIKYDQSNICHYFQQFGFGLKCMENEFKNLTKLHINQDIQKDALVLFKKFYPILFECLEAKFGLMPSSTRIVEQKHGRVRYSLRIGQGLDFNDYAEQYVTNIAYNYRERRRCFERKKRGQKRKGEELMSSKPQQVRHDEGKLLQYKVGEDTFEQGQQYKKDAIDKLPTEIKNQAIVRELSRKGTTSRNKILTSQKIEAASDKKNKRKKMIDTLEQLKENAKKDGVDNDKDWRMMSESEVAKQNDLDKLLTRTFWNSVPAKNIKSEAIRVLPQIQTDWEKVQLKKEICALISDHLSLVEQKITLNSWQGVSNWEKMDKYCRIGFFIKSDQCQILKEKKESKEKQYSAKKSFFQSCGKVISNRERYNHNKIVPIADEESYEDSLINDDR